MVVLYLCHVLKYKDIYGMCYQSNRLRIYNIRIFLDFFSIRVMILFLYFSMWPNKDYLFTSLSQPNLALVFTALLFPSIASPNIADQRSLCCILVLEHSLLDLSDRNLLFVYLLKVDGQSGYYLGLWFNIFNSTMHSDS